MTCVAFDRWLDEGRPAGGAAAARDHARGCDRCARALEAALELDAALGSGVPAPADFTERVMARVAETPQHAASVLPVVPAPLAPALPWWVRATTQPATLLATVLAAILLGWGDALVRGLAAWTSALSHSTSGLPGLGDPRVVVAVAVALAPSVVWVSRRLFLWGCQIAR